jgi:cyclopropane fatty-acyl-phospholipid synthase-like methyltransferase
MAKKLTPHFADVQAHYDLSDCFFRLFLDPTQTLSCAYFECEDMKLERHMKYLTGCARAFRIGHIDVNQFTLEK